MNGRLRKCQEADKRSIFIRNISFTPVQIVLTYEYTGINQTYIPDPGKLDYFDSDLFRIQLLDKNGVEIMANRRGFYTRNKNFDLEYHENRYRYQLPEVYDENITINIVDQNNQVLMSYKPLQQ